MVRTREKKSKAPPKRLLSASEADRALTRLRSDPRFFIEKFLGVSQWWAGMDRMLNAIPEAIKQRKPLVVGSGHALSKDFLISGCVPLWFLMAYGPSAKCAMTAPTDRQVKEVMWAELSNRYANRLIRFPEIGKLTQCKLDAGPESYILAFTTKDSVGAQGKFQGFHAAAVCVIVSEAQAVDDSIYDQIDGIMTSGVALQIYLGNPLHSSGRFASMLKDTTNNIVINLSCLDSPNYVAKKEVVPGMCSYDWVEDKRRRWGVDDPRWVSRVMGLVPKTSVNTVISDDLWSRCLNRDLHQVVRRGCIGVDPARFGDDDMIISAWESGRMLREVRLPYCTADTGCSHVVALQRELWPNGGVTIVVDCDGLGGPFADFLRKMVDSSVIIMDFNGSASGDTVSHDYQNLRAECAFYAREQMEAGNVSVNDDVMAREEATTEQYFINHRGKIQIEDKSDIKERIGRSPDRWDARKLAIWGLKRAEAIKPKSRWEPDDSSMMAPTSFMGV